MKICVLRRDGKDVHNGMVMVIPDIVVKFFGMKDVSIYKDKEEFTQMLVFEAGKEEESKKNTVLWVLAIIGAVTAVAAIAYGVYRYFTPDYLEDFEDDFEDDFDDDFDDDFFEDDDDSATDADEKKED